MARGERPLDQKDTALVRFAAGLRQLRRRAGTPTYRELARSAHYSVATLSEAAAGRRLPSLPVTLAYVRACGGDPAEWERVWREVAADLAAAVEPAEPVVTGSPYVGLAAFGPADADLFFGRERLVAELVDRLAERRFVAVFGASGAGKSSLLRAGLLPRWADRDGKPAAVVFTPGDRPLEECALQLALLTAGSTARFLDELTADPRGLHRAVRQALAGEPDHNELLIVVDQFEEAFTLCRDRDERDRFIDALLTAANASGSRCRVVLGVRADFYGHCTTHSGLLAAINAGQLGVGPMTVAELRRAITEPAARAGGMVAGELLATLVAETHGEVGVLPMLSHALRQTWRRRQGATLTLAGYQAAGGIDGALARTAEQLYTALDPDRQRLARDLFVRLTALGDGTEDTKRPLPRSELDGVDPELLDLLAQERLITLDTDAVEITHEALIRCWPRLRGWLAEDRDGLRVHRELTAAARAWESLDRDPGALYRGTRLDLARERARTPGVTLTSPEREFLAAGEAAAEQAQAVARRHARRLRRLVALLTVLLVVATGTGGWALRAQAKATEQRNVATAQRVAEHVGGLRATDPAAAAQLSLAAYRLSPTTETRGALLSTFATPYVTRLTDHGDAVTAVAFRPDGAGLVSAGADRTTRLWSVRDPHHPARAGVLPASVGPVRAVAVGPDGRWLVTGGTLGAIQVWDLRGTGGPRLGAILTGHTDEVTAVAVAPDGTRFATAGADRTVRLWSLPESGTPAALAVLDGGPDGVNGVAFQPDGRGLATAGADGKVRLWTVAADGRSARPKAVLAGHDGGVNAVTFGPDGRLLVSAGVDRTVRVWTAGGEPFAVLSEHTDAVTALAFGPDGHTLASAGADAAVRLWDLTGTPHSLGLLTGHTNGITSLAFAPDGRTLASGSNDHTVRLWDLRGPILRGHSSSVYGVAFSPDGRLLASGGYDRTVRLWDVRDPRRPGELAALPGHTGPVNSVAFDPAGHGLATASFDRTVRLWDLTDPRRPRTVGTLTGHTDAVESVTFGPDGTLAVTGSSDRTAVVWDVHDRAHPLRLALLTGHTAGVQAVAVGPGGRSVATAAADRTVRLWDTRDPRRPTLRAVLTGHTDSVKSVAFSPDGRLLVTASADRTAAVWDLEAGARPVRLATLSGYTDAVKSLAFASAGRLLVTGSSDRTVVVWDLADPRRPSRFSVLIGHTKPVDAVAVSPDGHTVASGSEDWTAVLWDLTPDRVADRVCAVTGPPLGREEWDQQFPGLAYDPPCSPH